jgi:DNA-directed RNA polymerase specialized sigma24 family protein
MVISMPKAIGSTSDAIRENLFTRLYEQAFPLVAKFISNRNGTFQHARDIFQDALVIFYEKQQQGLHVKLSDEAYVLGIAKHLWFRKYQMERSIVSLSAVEAAITIPDDYFPEVESNRLLQFLKLAGKKCMELLQSFYYHGSPIKEITKKYSYGSERSATVQKFKCLEKVRDHVREKSLHYEDFTQ